MDMSQLFIQAASYVGAITQFAVRPQPSTPHTYLYSELNADSQFSERTSHVKVQYILFWQSDEDDKAYCGWLDALYKDVHSDQIKRTPFPFAKGNEANGDTDLAKMTVNPDYAGCYINYPDVDMVRDLPMPADLGQVDKHPNWGVLYYGVDGFKKLMKAKAKYDPFNVFRHEMSIPVEKATP